MRLASAAWLTELRGLGRAFVHVLEAEWSALSAELGASGRTFLRALALFAMAIVILGWVAGLLSLAAVFLLSLYMPTWVSVLIVAGALALLAVLLILRGRVAMARAQPPAEIVKRRVDGHVAWLQSQVGAAGERGPGATHREPDDGAV